MGLCCSTSNRRIGNFGFLRTPLLGGDEHEPPPSYFNPRRSTDDLSATELEHFETEMIGGGEGDHRITMIEFSSLALGDRIGGGAEGIVYKGTWGRGKFPVAVKEMGQYEQRGREPRVKLQKFKHEASVLATLRHPNIVTFYGVSMHAPDADIARLGSSLGGSSAVQNASSLGLGDSLVRTPLWRESGSLGGGGGHDGRAGPVHCYIVTELCRNSLDNHELRDVLRKDRSGKLHAVVSQITSGMNYLHENGICHRDLKRQNILLDDEWRVVKICDFGLSSILKRDAQSMSVMVGTPAYMAPELIVSNLDTRLEFSLAIDVFSFGVLLWALWCNENPYARELVEQRLNSYSLLERITQGMRPQCPADMPRGLREVVEACWQYDNHARPTFPELAEQLACDPSGWGLLGKKAQKQLRKQGGDTLRFEQQDEEGEGSTAVREASTPIGIPGSGPPKR